MARACFNPRARTGRDRVALNAIIYNDLKRRSRDSRLNDTRKARFSRQLTRYSHAFKEIRDPRTSLDICGAL